METKAVRTHKSVRIYGCCYTEGIRQKRKLYEKYIYVGRQRNINETYVLKK